MAEIDRTGPLDATHGAFKLRKVTKANGALPDGTCRGLLVGSAGTLNIVDGSGETLADVPIQQGWNPLICQQVPRSRSPGLGRDSIGMAR
jgi:hypothetical protein